jgi:nicotinate-nucleotide adenylyltransferase
MSRIGIMGGTFNPIHIGHLIAANEVKERFGLDKVLFIPSGTPPHKPDSEVIGQEHRFEMVRLAVASNAGFEASRLEIDREGYTYTVNTLLELREMYDKETTFYFIIGTDVIPELKTWREFEKVFQLCEFIAVLRPGYPESSFMSELHQLTVKWGARIHPVQLRLIDISSTEIRERIMNGASIKYLVPDAVEEYILDKGLYKERIVQGAD